MAAPSLDDLETVKRLLPQLSGASVTSCSTTTWAVAQINIAGS
jgi:hypothetical protein